MRRDAIYYVFTHCLGAQEESLWDDIRTVIDMMRRRSILSGTQESEARPLHRNAEHAVDLISISYVVEGEPYRKRYHTILYRHFLTKKRKMSNEVK